MSSATENLALNANNLCKSYGDHLVLSGIELQVEKGSVHGLVGLNGSGKTTTLDCILGLQGFSEGSVDVLGHSPDKLYEAQGKIVSVFDSPCLNPNLTVRQTLTLGSLLCQGDTRSAADLETQLGIDRFSNFKIKDLSLGNKRRTSIAQALLAKPELVLLDEPFNGLDAGGVDDVLALIKSLNKTDGTTFLLSSHQLPYLEQVCSHLSILHKGQIVLSNSVDALLANRLPVALVRCAETETAINFIQTIAGARYLHHDELGFLHVELNGLDSSELIKLLVQNDVAVSELEIQKANLAKLFREVTSEVSS